MVSHARNNSARIGAARKNHRRGMGGLTRLPDSMSRSCSRGWAAASGETDAARRVVRSGQRGCASVGVMITQRVSRRAKRHTRDALRLAGVATPLAHGLLRRAAPPCVWIPSRCWSCRADSMQRLHEPADARCPYCGVARSAASPETV